MDTLYEIKASPGRGLGLFATRDCQPGVVIKIESAMMHVKSGGTIPEVESRVNWAFGQLSEDQRAQFLRLHQSHITFNTKAARIFYANRFGDDETSWVYLELSRVNHSCDPNAEITSDLPPSTKTHSKGHGDDGSGRLVVIKPIAAGEEVFISYDSVTSGECSPRLLTYQH